MNDKQVQIQHIFKMIDADEAAAIAKAFAIVESVSETDLSYNMRYVNNAHSISRSIDDRTGETIMTYAVSKEKIGIVKLLREHFADINAPRRDGKTPLAVAYERGAVEMVRFLLSRNADSRLVSLTVSSPSANQCEAAKLISDRMTINNKFPCHCCGYLVNEYIGYSEICRICHWEEDGSMLRWPYRGGGPNHVSLMEAQRNYQDFGASEERRRQRASLPLSTDVRDRGWRPISLEIDNFERSDKTYGPIFDSISEYYWRDSFWLKNEARYKDVGVFRVIPLRGVLPIEFGMTRKEAREVIGLPVSPYVRPSVSPYLSDTYLNRGFQVFFDADNRVEFIELRNSVSAVYKGFSVLETKATSVVNSVSKDAPYDESDPKLGYRYTFPDLEMRLWRNHIAKEQYDPDDYSGIYFLTMGLGKPGYYSNASEIPEIEE
ncbi:hypothetical protein CCAX7_56480 [Capsulimonas corticalis]|uniref:Uncharacterized protein n=1 Tax=Capsulimonas corticalis TaxID=2219043 RepID=A0A402D0H0_9BACT|nr:CPCC family cysteine-rich protein [Capsulimonas corticalis]BDI33597.1 hypothetical protein CCAX7_56480 [Capsulimonas corticalis]